MLTVPKDFNIPNGIEVEAKLVENGILYEFVEPQKEFYDFSEDILSDIIAEGYVKDEILMEFKNRKSKMHASFRNIVEDTLTNSKAMTKEELAAEIGL
ncbi:AbrB family transcriptional regulator [Enterococcus villorum]|uniref:AbrB family transcriptional regulator n=1 Tax=Enterococcus villorum TaxID=112904 RepID=A0A1V8YWZ1_9ENTE|nr:AbrB family transcriptional regulator [Enterococcus villorum]OQO70427.1 AbrB family transcriptional regulator [Enterococcus villorum]OQO77119.1 AbrB family transcriptional regulator [Enterococcus villorum]